MNVTDATDDDRLLRTLGKHFNTVGTVKAKFRRSRGHHVLLVRLGRRQTQQKNVMHGKRCFYTYPKEVRRQDGRARLESTTFDVMTSNFSCKKTGIKSRKQQVSYLSARKSCATTADAYMTEPIEQLHAK